MSAIRKVIVDPDPAVLESMRRCFPSSVCRTSVEMGHLRGQHASLPPCLLALPIHSTIYIGAVLMKQDLLVHNRIIYRISLGRVNQNTLYLCELLIRIYVKFLNLSHNVPELRAIHKPATGCWRAFLTNNVVSSGGSEFGDLPQLIVQIYLLLSAGRSTVQRRDGIGL